MTISINFAALLLGIILFLQGASAAGWFGVSIGFLAVLLIIDGILWILSGIGVLPSVPVNSRRVE